MTSSPNFRSTPMLSRLKAGLDRFDDTPEADLIGLAFVFTLPTVLLALGALCDGGL